MQKVTEIVLNEKNSVENRRQRTTCPIFEPLKDPEDRVLLIVPDALKHYIFMELETV